MNPEILPSSPRPNTLNKEAGITIVMVYQWKGSATEMTNGPASQGKMDAVDGSSALKLSV